MVSLVSYCLASGALLAISLSSAWYSSLGVDGGESGRVVVAQLLNSWAHVLILMNGALCLLLILGRMVQSAFFGTLRASEVKVMISDPFLSVVVACKTSFCSLFGVEPL